MSLESYTGKIADLVVTNPTPTDPKSQGDDHLRGIKYTLQQTFPGFDGPLASTPGEIDRVVSAVPASGLPFCKNKLINGEVTRINQRGVANWAAVANGAYGYDRWKKIDASNMTQIIEAGNFRPNTVHTLSGIGVTTQQITSPASGNWTLPNIPIAATNVQVEEGLEATPFEVRHIGFELGLCQRYYQVGLTRQDFYSPVGGAGIRGLQPFSVQMRVGPAMVKTADILTINVGGLSVAGAPPDVMGYVYEILSTTIGNVQGAFTWSANAEL